MQRERWSYYPRFPKTPGCPVADGVERERHCSSVAFKHLQKTPSAEKHKLRGDRAEAEGKESASGMVDLE